MSIQCSMFTRVLKERKGKGYIAVPACGGSLAEAKRACTLAILDDVNYRIPLHSSQAKLLRLEANSDNLEARRIPQKSLTSQRPHVALVACAILRTQARLSWSALASCPCLMAPPVFCPAVCTSRCKYLAKCTRQPHQMNANQRHVHLLKIKYREDTRPGQQLELAQRQHADLCKHMSAKDVSLLTILLVVGGTFYTEHTLDQLERIGLDHQ
eukprot:1146229-Pelagomonas_calceolata.AAC.1